MNLMAAIEYTGAMRYDNPCHYSDICSATNALNHSLDNYSHSRTRTERYTEYDIRLLVARALSITRERYAELCGEICIADNSRLIFVLIRIDTGTSTGTT